MTRPAASTLGELRASGWRRRSVKEEMRANLLERIRRGEQLLPGILGYDETVLPQIENAILAGQDIILLGERGQAKSRIARSLVALLDEWIPAIAGAELHDDPFFPRLAVRGTADRGAGRRDTDHLDPARGPLRGEARDARHHASRTSSARSTRSRSPRAATCPTS